MALSGAVDADDANDDAETVDDNPDDNVGGGPVTAKDDHDDTLTYTLKRG